MQLPEPTSEHHWLMQLVGSWSFVHECDLGPGQPSSKSSGTQVTRALGAFWTIGDMVGQGPDGSMANSIMTVGFDNAKGKFVGTFHSSCMNMQWIYEGSLDSDKRILTLDSYGPSFSGDGSTALYQDIIEIVDANSYLFRSRYQMPDGTWNNFMNGTYTRVS